MNNLSKGASCEEKVRNYFLKLGIFSVRSIPCLYNGIDITDIDIWLYSRPSPLSRHRVNVDIKYKKTPQAIERIFWSIGLREAYGLDECIVVTTDKRPEVSLFGKKVNVNVLDGNFLPRLNAFDPSNADINRYTEEEFKALVVLDRDFESANGWYGDYLVGKEKLLNSLDFNGVNYHLSSCLSRCENISAQTHKSGIATRLLAAHLSHMLISLDYCMKDIVFKSEKERIDILDSGFQFGAMGFDGVKSMIDRNDGLIKQFAPEGAAVAAKVRSGVMLKVQELGYSGLRDYFIKGDINRDLYEMAVECENIAFSKINLNAPSEFPQRIKSIVGVLADHANIDRKKVI